MARECEVREGGKRSGNHTCADVGECGGCRWREAVKGEEAPGPGSNAGWPFALFRCISLKMSAAVSARMFLLLYGFFSFLPVSG